MALGVSLPALFRASAAEGPAPCLFLSGDSRLPRHLRSAAGVSQDPPEKQTQRDVCTQRETGSRSCGDTSPNPRDRSADPSPGRSRRPSPEPVRWQGSFLLGGGRGSVFVRSKPSTGWRRPTHVMEGHLPPQSAQPAAPGAEARPPGSPLPSLPFPKPQPRDKRAEGPMTEGAGSVGAWPILFHNVIWLL